MNAHAKWIRRIIKWSVSVSSTKESGPIPIQSVSYNSKPSTPAVPWFSFGTYGRAPKGTLNLTLHPHGDPSEKVILPGSFDKRPTIEEGEYAIFHEETGSIVLMKNDGSVEVTAPEIKLIGNLTVTGKLDVEGAAQFDDAVTVDGATALGSIVTSGGTSIGKTHKHVGSLTAPTGSQVNTGDPI